MLALKERKLNDLDDLNTGIMWSLRFPNDRNQSSVWNNGSKINVSWSGFEGEYVELIAFPEARVMAMDASIT